MITANRYHDISVGHRVHGHESKCRHLHGHNYRVHFEVAADVSAKLEALGDSEGLCHSEKDVALDTVGRVMDFSVIKERLCMWLEDNWDHKFLAWEQDDFMNMIHDAYKGESQDARDADLMLSDSLVWTPFNPTAENMAEYLVNVIGPQQLEGTGVILVKCIIEETRKCSVTYTKKNED